MSIRSIRFPFRWLLSLPLTCIPALAMQAQPNDDAGALAPVPGPPPVLGELEVEHFSVDDGLPDTWVNDIARDSSGFLWISGSAT